MNPPEAGHQGALIIVRQKRRSRGDKSLLVRKGKHRYLKFVITTQWRESYRGQEYLRIKEWKGQCQYRFGDIER